MADYHNGDYRLCWPARGVVVIVGDEGKNFTRDKHFHRKGYGWRCDQGGGDEGNSLQKEQRILGVSVTWP